MQKWEYERITRTRYVSGEKIAGAGNIAGAFGQSGKDFGKQLNDLGSRGRELVSVATYSDYSGDSFAGITTTESWIFKRPIG